MIKITETLRDYRRWNRIKRTKGLRCSIRRIRERNPMASAAWDIMMSML
jgi:hypothetical protein